MSTLLGYVGILGTSLFSLWAAFRYVILGTYRLNGDTSKRLVDKVKSDAKWTWVLTGEYVTDPRYPTVFEALVLLGRLPLYVARGERLLTAGWQGKEDMSYIMFFRWDRQKVDKLLSDGIGADVVPISALLPRGNDRLGELTPDSTAAVYLNEGSYEDIEHEVSRVASGELRKTGCLLYGRPGNGKTQFVKYLSKKYSLPINVVYLNPDYDNYEIAKMFSEVQRRCIVLFEDFDNYFDGRECTMKNDKVKFTFDSIINAMDGVHNDYRGVVFVMTVNDLDKVDDSIKRRPSRFKFVREFSQPNEELRRRILGDCSEVQGTAGMTLDQVFAKKKN